MKEYFVSFLKARKNKTITLSELEKQVSGDVDYKKFADIILNLEEMKVLSRVKSHGENNKCPSLALTYRINKNSLNQQLSEKLKIARLQLHPSINLDAYFHLPEEQWEKDQLFIYKINNYITSIGYPKEKVPGPERSYELVKDEKWITEGGGRELLDRIQVWDQLLIMPVSDPLMFALNTKIIDQKEHLHLIVENKTTFQALLPALQDGLFSTLIYGSGKKIIKSIEQFEYQLPLPAAKHQFYYFGDLDYEGIFIWHLLSKKISVLPALPFYKACLDRPYAFGKQNQRPNEEALNAFLGFLGKKDQETLLDMFRKGGYYPQEIIKSNELQQIWRNSSWK